KDVVERAGRGCDERNPTAGRRQRPAVARSAGATPDTLGHPTSPRTGAGTGERGRTVPRAKRRTTPPSPRAAAATAGTAAARPRLAPSGAGPRPGRRRQRGAALVGGSGRPAELPVCFNRPPRYSCRYTHPRTAGAD